MAKIQEQKEVVYKIFICHASEDKDAIAERLAELLQKHVSSVGYDKYFISNGDKINDKIHAELNQTKFDIVIFSASFFEKSYTRYELGIIDNKRKKGESVLYPVYYKFSEQELSKHFPHLGDMHADILTKEGLTEQVEKIIKAIQKAKTEEEILLNRAKRKQKIQSAILISCFLSIFAFSLFYLYPILKGQPSVIEPIEPGGLRILILPFNQLSSDRSRNKVEDGIILNLEKKNKEEHLGIQILRDTTHLNIINRYEQIKELNKKYKADIAFYGELDDEKNTHGFLTAINYIDLSNDQFSEQYTAIPESGSSGSKRISNVTEIKEGKLIQNVDFIIYWILAVKATKNERNELALKYYLILDSLRPDVPFVQEIIGVLSASYGKNKEAKSYLEKAIKLSPNNGEYLVNYAKNLLQFDRDTNQGQYFYDLALKNNFDDANVNFEYGLFLWLYDQGKENSKKYVEKAINMRPNEWRYYKEYGNILLEVFKDTTGALNQYRHSFELNPINTEAYYNYANAIFDRYPDTAKVYYEKILSMEPDRSVAAFGLAGYWDSRQQFDSAEKYIRLTVQNEQSDPYILSSCFKFLSMKNKITKSDIPLMRLAVKLDSLNIELNYHYASHLQEFSKYDSSCYYYLKTIRLKPDFAEGYVGYAFLQSYIYSNNVEANRYYEKGIAMCPRNSKLQYEYSVFLLERIKDKTKAKKYYLSAKILDPLLRYHNLEKVFGK